MIKYLVTFLLLLAFNSAFAEACPHFEYAELKDMSQSELQSKYCQSKKYQASHEEQSRNLAKEGSLTSLDYLKYSFKCETEANRIFDIFKKSFSPNVPVCE